MKQADKNNKGLLFTIFHFLYYLSAIAPPHLFCHPANQNKFPMETAFKKKSLICTLVYADSDEPSDHFQFCLYLTVVCELRYSFESVFFK